MQNLKTDTVVRELLINEAKDGKPKPKTSHKYYHVFNTLIRHDPAFKKEIEASNKSWLLTGKSKFHTVIEFIRKHQKLPTTKDRSEYGSLNYLLKTGGIDKLPEDVLEIYKAHESYKQLLIKAKNDPVRLEALKIAKKIKSIKGWKGVEFSQGDSFKTKPGPKSDVLFGYFINSDKSLKVKVSIVKDTSENNS